MDVRVKGSEGVGTKTDTDFRHTQQSLHARKVANTENNYIRQRN